MHALMPLRAFNVGFNFISNKYKRQYFLPSLLKASLKWMIKKDYCEYKNICNILIPFLSTRAILNVDLNFLRTSKSKTGNRL